MTLRMLLASIWTSVSYFCQWSRGNGKVRSPIGDCGPVTVLEVTPLLGLAKYRQHSAIV